MAPEEISSVRQGAALRITWSDGLVQELDAPALRLACRCAHCLSARLHGDPSTLAGPLKVAEIRPVGLYAVQLVFDDGHARGIYPWHLLREQG